DKPVVTWFGHSSYLIQAEGLNILVDPVFSRRVSFAQYIGPSAYPGSMIVSVKDLPAIDAVIISHDHYDHLDYGTILQLREKVKAFYVPLGVGSHLAYWGVPDENITELDWWDSVDALGSLKLTAAPARHFSGRGFTRNKTLWASFVLEMEGYKLYLGGDSGYDRHFREIGDKFGPFDLVILENGQYNPQWPFIHMMPEETVQASLDLRGKVLLPVHWGKFTLAVHAWNDPAIRVVKKAEEMNVKVTTPRIGEPIVLDSVYPSDQWWDL
ncbi:MAG TPA: MBL fold metallo-hydrolase, partial [Anseongella sp.]|nr:MBL fold metallo-hydrolase [Anseongella sp.]